MIGLCLSGWISSPVALVLGILFAITLGNPWPKPTKKYASSLLQLSVMGLGAGMNLSIIIHAGFYGMGYTFFSILVILLAGLLLGKWMKVSKNTALLISVGTAICGGSAIAAVAPVIRARPQEISFSLAIIFFLNAVALVLFPPVGHIASLSPEAFGLWSALAIHDTSSVVGAAISYGNGALEVATPIKLARALWIVPLTFALAWTTNKSKSDEGPIKKPWFILGFVILAAFFSWFPGAQNFGASIASISKRTLILTLFLIGSGLSRSTIRSVGYRPMLQGATLWLLVSIISLQLIRMRLLI